ncbi:alpha/beta hydrolase [Roseobacter sp. YSTF-M11]|uniref:Alpha/beta hydrolase n=1 Tax=Roseobacter insulae TaxID=2859783 RepID=A0A9X1K3W7_9RHOB|nr:alpha/beta hydrolase [Roseobacter insulae]MBW4709963.1 alpha/beta hydrolase [Roseobacter insulae]
MTWTTRPRSDGAGDLSYICSGVGTPLVLVHGVGLRAEAWAGMMPMLSEHFKVCAVDMPGHGSSPLSKASQLHDYVSRVTAFVDDLDTPCYIAGHSMGAMIALDVAAARGDRIKGVAALNGVFNRSDAATRAVRARADALSHAGPADPTPTLQRWFGDTPEGALHDAAEACAAWLKTADRQGYARAYQVFATTDGPDDRTLAALKMPALFMTGAQDPNSTPAMSHNMAARSPQGVAIIHDRAAHMMPMTHPGDVNAALIGQFSGKEVSRAG